MKQYELTVLIHPDLEMNLTPALDKINKLIESQNGKIVKETNKQDYAVYYFYELELPAQAPAKISSTLNITDEVLRYLLVTVDERKAKFEAKRKARAEKTKDTEESAE